jgi:hypothetical protein
MALSRERAANALARVESDPAALATFLAAYSGDEDAVPALLEAADPAVASAASLARAARLTEYERVAYGRTNTPDEEAVAANARDEIVWEEDHRSAISAALEAAVAALDPAGEAASAPSAPAAQTELEPPPVARKRFRFTVPVVVAVAIVGIAVGAVIATGVGRQPGSTGSGTPTPSATGAPIGGSVTRTYTADQVSGWFSATATGADTFPRPSYLTSIGLNNDSTRFIATGSAGWSLWVGKSPAGQTCLLLNGTIKTPTKSLSSCLPSAAIGQGRAIVINAHGINATLTRNDLVVAITEGDQGP